MIRPPEGIFSVYRYLSIDKRIAPLCVMLVNKKLPETGTAETDPDTVETAPDATPDSDPINEQ